MYDSVLVPTDGSTESMEALDHALDIAAQYDATLHAIYVVDDTVVDIEEGAYQVVDALEDAGGDAVDRVRERADARGVEVVASVLHGRPHRAILDYAADEDIDLIVMSTHGRTGLERYLLGSVTEKVVRLAEVPVLAVRAEDDEE